MLILHNARVATFEAGRSQPSALAIAGDRIVAVGGEDLASVRPRGSVVVNLGGRTVAPGLIDAHAHLDREGLRRAYPTLRGCRSIADVQAVVGQAAAGRPAGAWLVVLPLGEPPFHQHQPLTLAEARYPDRHDLDAATPDHPVWIRAIWGYWDPTVAAVHVLNSAALWRLGIDRDTKSPASTVDIEHDEAGEPTGRILERFVVPTAEHTLLAQAPRFTPEVRLAALRHSIDLALEAGITGIYEGHGVAEEVGQLYERLHRQGQLRLRAYLPLSLPPWGSLAEAGRFLADWAAQRVDDGWIRRDGVYLNLGGEPGAAAISHAVYPYTGWAGFVDQHNSLEEYAELCRLAFHHGVRVGSVAGPLEHILSVWETLERDEPSRQPLADRRWVLIHTRQPNHSQLARIRRLGAVLTTQPAAHVYQQRLQVAHRDKLRVGVPVALSTDNQPYFMPFALCAAASEYAGDQQLSPLEAWHMAAQGGAYVCFDEHRRGAIAPGRLADLAVFEGDLASMGSERLRDLAIDATLVGGQVMHSRIEQLPVTIFAKHA